MRSTRQPLLSVALICTVFAFPAFAQRTPASYPPPCDAAKVSKGDSDRAHTVFLSGKQYLDESNYDKAISYFNDAYSIDCSVHGILPIIATAFERRGDRSEAVHALEEYLRRAPNAPDHEIVERRIRNLKDQVAREQAAAAPPPPTATAAPPPPAPSVTPEPPPPPPVASEPPPPPPPPRISPGPGPWVMVGLGGAGAVAGIALYAAGAGDISDAEKACGNSRMNCAPTVAQKGNSGRGLETAGGVVTVVGLAAIASGLVWYFTSPKPAPTTAGSLLTPVILPGYVGVAMSGRL